MSRSRVLVTVAALGVCLAPPIAFAGSAAAAPPPLDGFSDLLVVPADFGGPAHIVMSSGTSGAGGGIVVLDADGTDPRRVPGVTEVNNLALAPDGRVWATVAAGSIVSFSPDDPGLVVASHPVDVPCPYDLAVASDGIVWFGSGCVSGQEPGLYALDPESDDEVVHVTTGWHGGLLRPLTIVENNYLHPDTIVIGDRSADGLVDVISVTGTTATDLRSTFEPNLYDVAVADDGASMVVAHDFYAPTRFTVPAAVGDPIIGEQTYSGGAYVNSVAISPDGKYVVTGTDYDHQFRTFGPSSNLVLRTYTPNASDAVPYRAVGWLDHLLVTVTIGASGPVAHLHGDATDLPSTLTVTGPAKGMVDKAFTLSGTLSSRGAVIQQAPLTVTRSDGNGTVTAGHGTTRNDGTYRISVTPPNGEYVTYTVSYLGADGQQPAKASRRMWVDRLPTFLSINTNYDAYWYHSNAQITVHLGTTYRSRYVRVYANQAGLGKKQIAAGLVDGSGRFTTSFRMARNTSFSAYFGGDLRRAPKTVSHFVHTAVIPTLTLKDYYGTDGNGNRLYHKRQEIHQTAHVEPNKAGQCVYFDVQEKKDGRWHDLGFSGCFALGPHSNVDAWFDTPDFGVIGRVYRFGFFWKSDSYNLGVGSLWRYAKVTA